MEVLEKAKAKADIEFAVQRTKVTGQMAEFKLLLDATVSQLKCDAACVNTCVAAALTLDAKALCLDTCLCYATPAAPVPAPAVAPVVTPAAAPATPVVAEPVVAQTVVATPEPVVGAQQALFLTEDALVMSANGSLQGIVVLASTLALITLMGAAAAHYNAYGKKGFTLKGLGLKKGNKKNEGFQEAEEYLLIK